MGFEGNFTKGMKKTRAFQAEGPTYAESYSNEISVSLKVIQVEANKDRSGNIS